MPGNAFIKFTTIGDGKAIKGESLQDGHAGKDGWTEIAEWNWEITADTSFTKGTGAAVGKPMPGALTFTHYYDISSPVFLQYIVKGTHFKSVQIDMLKQVGDKDGKPAVFFSLMASRVFISKVASKGGEDGSVNQDVEMVFKEVQVGYKRQDNNGLLDKAPKTFPWNIALANDTVGPDVKLSM